MPTLSQPDNAEVKATFRLDQQLWRRIRIHAITVEKPVQEICSEALTEYLDKEAEAHASAVSS